jgi:hypothetical protein
MIPIDTKTIRARLRTRQLVFLPNFGFGIKPGDSLLWRALYYVVSAPCQEHRIAPGYSKFIDACVAVDHNGSIFRQK